MANSYNGWPGITNSNDSRLTIIEPVANRKFRVRAGSVATVFNWLIQRFHNEVEAIDTGVLDDWSYNYRKVVGGSSLSNHASGTAVDLNATKHPFETKATANFTGAQIAKINSILEDTKVNGQYVIRWLDGHDPMHFEINYVARGGTPSNVDALAAKVTTGTTPAPSTPSTPSTPVAFVGLKPKAIDYTNPDEALVRITQEIVGVKADGIRGPKTKAATKAHQKKLGMKDADSLFGPKHALAYLLSVPNLYMAKADEKMPAPAIKLIHWIAGLQVDDSFGSGLDNAVKRMQTWAGIYPDGNVGDTTKRKIVL